MSVWIRTGGIARLSVADEFDAAYEADPAWTKVDPEGGKPSGSTESDRGDDSERPLDELKITELRERYRDLLDTPIEHVDLLKMRKVELIEAIREMEDGN